MTLCPSCGAENVDGTKFCVKCGAGLMAAPSPGAWEQPAQPTSSSSGNLYDTPSGGAYGTPSGGLGGQPGGYQPMSQPPTPYGYGGAVPAVVGGVGGYPYAEWIDRVLAALIDGGISFAVMIALYIVFGIIGGIIGGIGSSMGSDAVGTLGGLSCCFGFLLAAISVFVVGIYNKVFLVSKRGFSIGQGVMKLKVVDAMGNIPQMGTLVLRLLVQIALGFIPIIGFFLGIANALWPLWDEKKQTLHDKAVNTFVVKTG